MKGFIEHLIAENKKLEQDLIDDYEALHAPVSHRELLAMQLRGDEESWIINMADCGLLTSKTLDIASDLLEEADRILERQRSMGIRTVSFLDTMSYPASLNDLGVFRPLLLHGMGDWELLDAPRRIAVIGSRHASDAGLVAARNLGRMYGAGDAGHEPCVVISGLACGCDTAAHEGCLDAGGDTVAVVATGLDRVYPAENVSLFQRILDEGGLVLSEHQIGIMAVGNLRPHNRIIAALAELIAVPECRKESGTMDAVEKALRLGRDVRVIAHSVYDTWTSGNEWLLSSGMASPV